MNVESAYAKSFGVASAERPTSNANAILQMHATQAMLSEGRRGHGAIG